jgi:hypothetical protein
MVKEKQSERSKKKLETKQTSIIIDVCLDLSLHYMRAFGSCLTFLVIPSPQFMYYPDQRGEDKIFLQVGILLSSKACLFIVLC